jgi:Flp pilus assembly protein TadB
VADEIATGSASSLVRRIATIGAVHLPRPPSIDRGTSAGLWAIGFGLYIFFGALAVGVSLGVSFIATIVAIGLIFLFVRLYGADERRSPARR